MKRNIKTLKNLFIAKTFLLVFGTVVAVALVNVFSIGVAKKNQEKSIGYISKLIAKELQIINDLIPNGAIILNTLKRFTEEFHSIEEICFISDTDTICYPKNREPENKSYLSKVKKLYITETDDSIKVTVPIYEEYASEILQKKKIGVAFIVYDKSFFEFFITYWNAVSIVVSLTIAMIGMLVGAAWYSEIASNFKLLNRLLDTLKNEPMEFPKGTLRPILNSITLIELKRLAFLVILFYKRINHLNKKVKYLAIKDSLTGLYNRNYLELVIKQSFISIWQRQKIPITVAMIDIDDFKRINDTFGHQKGDEVLKKLGEVIRKSTRKGDFPIRYGGEEFLIIFPYTGKQETYKVISRIKELFSKVDFGVGRKITFSAGISGYPEDTDEAGNLDLLIELADKRLYIAKAHGKNRIVYG